MKSRPEKGNASVAVTTEASNVKNQAINQGFNVNNSTVVPANSQPVFNFGDNQVRVVVREGAPWFVAADIWSALKLTNPSKAMKVLEPHERSNFKLGRQGDVNIVSESGLYTLILRCRDAIKPGTVAHQFKTWVTSEVLPSIRKTGGYERQEFAVNPGDLLTRDEAETLRLMLKTAADRVPKAKQGALMMKGWSKLKSHFGVSYREIPRHEFSEAVSIIARHTAEWEVVDDEPLAGQRRALAELPRLHLSHQPPAIGTYRHDRVNPYPWNGRTIEMAKSIVADIRHWGEGLPAGSARNDLCDATQTLQNLLVSGWTEVDEALSQISTAVHYLSRWQGRGGRVGNVG